MGEQMAEIEQHEIEDLWWFRHCVEGLLDGRDADDTVRVGLLRALLKTTKPETSITDPREAQ